MSQKVQVYVSNRTATLTSAYDEERLTPYWSYSNPNYKWIIRAKPWLAKTWDGREHFLRDDQLPAGLFWATRKEIEEKEDIRFIVSGDLDRPNLEIKNILGSDRSYQNACVEKMLKVIRFGGGLILGATGTGKTRIASMFFSRVTGEHLFVVDQLVLMEQAIDELEDALKEKIGWVGDSEYEPQRITVATRQSMFIHQMESKFKDWTNRLQTILIDEIHEQMNNSNFSTVENIQPLAVFGLTATLSKKKKSRLRAYSLCGPVIYEYPLKQGQEEGYLSQAIAVRLLYANPVSREEQKTFSWTKLYSSKIVDNDQRNWLVSELVQEAWCRNKYIIVLVTRVKHLKKLSGRLRAIPHRIVSGTFKGQKIEVKDRIESKSKFEAGDIRLIIANTVFKKGVNLKRVDMIIDCDAGRSENDAVQKFGRGIRKHEDKLGLIYFDINDWDEANPKNWFHIASRYRTRALQRAGVKLHKVIWRETTTAKTLLVNAQKWLEQHINKETKENGTSSSNRTETQPQR